MSNKNQGGRHKDTVWGFYEEVSKNISSSSQNVLCQKCKACGAVVSGRVIRMKTHLEKCKQKIISDPDEVSVSTPMPKRVCFSTNSEDEIINIDESPSTSMFPISKKEKQPSIYKFVLKTTTAEKNVIDVQIAKFFYSCNIPFNVAENKHFKAMITKLRPGYEPPNRKKLAIELLDKVHADVISTVAEELNGKTVTLMQDGWSDIHNSPIIANCVSTGRKSFFLSAIDVGAAKKSSEYCLKIAMEAKEEVEQKYNCKVRSFVSDSENKMKRMRADLQIAYKDELFISYGCAAHCLNLLGQDITNVVNSVMKHVVDVNKYFRNNNQPAGWLNEYTESVKPQLPGETRWKSQVTCLKSFLDNRDFYMKIVDLHEEDIEKRIVNVIHNISLYKEVKHLIGQLNPIAQAIDRLQGECSTISDVCAEWLALLKIEELATYSKMLHSRFEQNITPAHYMAYVLSPTYMGEGLDEEKQEVARKWLSDEIDASFLPLLIAFQAESVPFSKSYFSESVRHNIEPITWWEAMKKNKNIDTKFLDFATHLMKCCASSASIERLFSKFGGIQNKLRNRLTLQNTAKLAECNQMLNSK